MAGRGNPVTLVIQSLTGPPLKVKCQSNRWYAVVVKQTLISGKPPKAKVELRSDDPNTIANYVRRGATTRHVFDLETGSLIWSGLPASHGVLKERLNRWHQAKGR
jgi:hypothetical protein